MASDSVSETRAKILRVALERFHKRGFHATSVQEIADRVGVTKAAVLYHFREKVDIVGALAEPMLDQLDAALAAARLAQPAEARRAVLEGVLEVWLAHRYLLRMNLQDLAVTTNAIFGRFRAAMLLANTLVAGRDPDLAERVRAAQAIAMLADPVILFADAPTDVLRGHVLANVHKLFAPSEMTSRAPTKRRGRKSLLDPKTEKDARRMHAAGKSADEIAAKLGVSRATIYRHLRESHKS